MFLVEFAKTSEIQQFRIWTDGEDLPANLDSLEIAECSEEWNGYSVSKWRVLLENGNLVVECWAMGV